MVEVIESGKIGRSSDPIKVASKVYICNYLHFQAPPIKHPIKEGEQNTIIKTNNTKDILHFELQLVGNHWNSKEIVVHGPATIAKCEVVFKRNLLAPFGRGDYWTDDICKAICNYCTVLSDKKYFWDHRWTLREFLQRGVDRFVDEAKPLENFLAKKIETQPMPTGRVTHTRECSRCRTGWAGIELDVNGLCERCRSKSP